MTDAQLDLPDVHRRSLEATRAKVAAIAEGQWRDATPCGDWDVRTLVDHVVGGNLWVGELATGHTIADVGDRLDGDNLGADPVAAYDRSARIAAEAFSAPGAMDAPCAVSYGPVPGAVYCGHRIVDVLIHGWDIAVATGQDRALDPDLVDAAAAIVAPQAALLAGSGMFGQIVAVPDGADPQTRLLAQLGRQA
jgi:uncharacterized protein (TIGR03086 family)